MESDDLGLMVFLFVIMFVFIALLYRHSNKKSDLESKNRILWKLITIYDDKVKIEDFGEYLYNNLQLKFEAIFPPSKKVLREQREVSHQVDLNIADYIQEHHRMDENFYYISPRKLDTVMRREIENELKRNNFNV
ncbi:MAG: hypothetical protein ACP5D9_11345 [Mariniphaga sp.]